jgi:hypothetical protein
MSIPTAKHGVRPPSIEEVKARYSIADAWRDEGLPGQPARSCKSQFRDDRHNSFSVYDNGRRWKDHADDCGGDVINFIAKARGVSQAEALAAVRERTGWRPGSHGPALSRAVDRPKPAPQSKAPAYKPAAMDGEVLLAWEAGLHFLARVDHDRQAETDRWRAWPAGTTQFLAGQGLLGAPQWEGQRGLAWLVQYPRRGGWMPVGFHMRHNPRREGERAGWTYQPSGCGMPGVPLVLGNFYGARVVIACEGEWDAATFAAAAGWLANATAWPDAVAVMGIRGATGWRTFLEHWRPHWPRRAKFLLIPDNDEAGLRWQRDFAGELAPLALSVKVATPAPGGPKDFNDMHRAKPFLPEDIRELLHYFGLFDGRGLPV